MDPAAPTVRSRRIHWLERQADRAVQRLYDQVRSHPPEQRSGRLLAAVITSLALLVHAITVALIVGAVVVGFFVPGLPRVVRVVAVVLLVGAAVAVQPLRRRRASGLAVKRSDTPALYDLLDEIATSVGCPRTDQVLLFAGFNAYFTRSRSGGRQLGIGLSLWTVLDGQARVAILGHELGHAVNGDLRRTRVVRLALFTLSRWRDLLRPHRPSPWRRYTRYNGAFFDWLAAVILFPLSLVVGVIGRSLSVVADRQGQRAEYRADEIGARAAGSEGARQAMEMLMIGDFCERTVGRSIRFAPNQDPWPGLRSAVLSIPSGEWERRRRVARRRMQRIDVTHPPTRCRVDMIAARPERSAEVRLDPDRSARIDAELDAARARVAAELRVANGQSGVTARSTAGPSRAGAPAIPSGSA